MAWHPDRFVNDSQKQKAEEELKAINAARDCLRLHFSKHHNKHGQCACQYDQQAQAAPPQPHPQPPPVTPQPAAARLDPTRVLSSPIAATVALCILSFATISAYFKVTSRPPAGHDEASDNQVGGAGGSENFTAIPAQDRGLPGAPADTGPAGFLPEARQATVSPAPTEAGSAPWREPADVNRSPHAVAGTFYAGFVERQEQRRQQALDAQRLALTSQLSQVEKDASRLASELSRTEGRMTDIDKEAEEHKAVLSEIERADGELEKSPMPGAVPSTVSVYFTNVDYKRHFDACTQLAQEKQALTDISNRIKQKLSEQRRLIDGMKTALGRGKK